MLRMVQRGEEIMINKRKFRRKGEFREKVEKQERDKNKEKQEAGMDAGSPLPKPALPETGIFANFKSRGQIGTLLLGQRKRSRMDEKRRRRRGALALEHGPPPPDPRARYDSYNNKSTKALSLRPVYGLGIRAERLEKKRFENACCLSLACESASSKSRGENVGDTLPTKGVILVTERVSNEEQEFGERQFRACLGSGAIHLV